MRRTLAGSVLLVQLVMLRGSIRSDLLLFAALDTRTFAVHAGAAALNDLVWVAGHRLDVVIFSDSLGSRSLGCFPSVVLGERVNDIIWFCFVLLFFT